MNFLIESGPDNGTANPCSAAKDYAAAAAERIRSTLSAGKRDFRLMPYRVGCSEYLGFDWFDEARNSVVFTFVIGEQKPLPTKVDADNEIWVGDTTDALLLARQIATAVAGNSLGYI